MIWKLRCEWKFEREPKNDPLPSELEIHNRWLASINKRLLLDYITTNKKKYGKRATSKKLVAQTWNGVLLNSRNLLDSNIQQSGVLVGIQSLRPPGRNR